MKKAFLVNTPYQLLNMLNIADSLDNRHSIDVYLTDPSVSGYKDLLAQLNYKVIDLSSFFRIKTYKNRIINKLNLLLYILKKKNGISRLIECDYSIIYMAYPNIMNRIIYSCLNKRKKMSVVLYEDGVGTYTSLLNGKRHSESIEKIFKLLLGENPLWVATRLLVNYPSLVEYDQMNINIDKIDSSKIFSNKFVTEYFRIKFTKEIDIFNKSDLVFFDQVLMLNNPSLTAVQMHYFDEIREENPHKKALIKLHPRYNGNHVLKDYFVLQTDAPLEILIMLCKNIENKTFVSVASSACVTPKLIFDKEPVVYILYSHFLNFQEINKADIHFFERIKDIYREREKFQLR